MDGTNKKSIWFVLTQHWLSLTGCAFLLTAVISWLFVLPLHIRGHVDNPYVGIIAFLIIPILFFTGLALVPIGVLLSRRSIKTTLAEEEFDRRKYLRRLGLFFAVTTIVNLLVGTQITYRAVKHMETPQFCGATCHTMAPEYAAYLNSPHSRVECVECHVAPGASGWISSKTAGIRQLVETFLNTYRRPIPSALESNRLIPARQTCENCHWPQMFGGVRLRVLSRYADDESNSRTQTVLLMMIGGSRLGGIHGAHFGPGVHIRFTAADPARQTITSVEYRNADSGAIKTFASAEAKVDGNARSFEMECVDCHNRPTHAFDLPDRAVNNALARGELSVTLPFIKKKAVELLNSNFQSNKDATEKIRSELEAFYRQNYADLYAKRSRDVDQAGETIVAIYNRNVFPDLKVSWGTYPNNLGHMDFPGCFRCHDGSHVASDGSSINQSCDACHQILATDEASPEILKQLGIAERISNIQKQ